MYRENMFNEIIFIFQLIIETRNRSVLSMAASDPDLDTAERVPKMRPASAPQTRNEKTQAKLSAGEVPAGQQKQETQAKLSAGEVPAGQQKQETQAKLSAGEVPAGQQKQETQAKLSAGEVPAGQQKQEQEIRKPPQRPKTCTSRLPQRNTVVGWLS